MKEAYTAILLENSRDRKINRFLKGFIGTDDLGTVRDFLARKLYLLLPNLRLYDGDVVCKCIQLIYNPDGTLRQGVTRYEVRLLYDILNRYRSERGIAKDMILPANDLSSLISNEKSKIGNSVKKADSVKKRTTPNGYVITRIDSYDELKGSTNEEWCIGYDRDMYDWIVGESNAVVYIAANPEFGGMWRPLEAYGADGEEHDPDEFEDDHSLCGSFGSGIFPYDKYGLSAICVLVYDDGSSSTYSRWNIPDSELEGDEDFLTRNELSRLIGMPFNEAFPYVEGTFYGTESRNEF